MQPLLRGGRRVELVLQVLALGLIVPDPNEGRQTDIYTIGDELRSYFGFRSIPPVTIGNIIAGAVVMAASYSFFL